MKLNKPLVKIVEVSFASADLRRLPADHGALLLASAAVANELRECVRQFLLCGRDDGVRAKSLEPLWRCATFRGLRALSDTLCDADAFFTAESQRFIRLPDDDLVQGFLRFRREFRLEDDSAAGQVARGIRRRAIARFDLSSAQASLDAADRAADVSAHMHSINPNTVYSFADDLIHRPVIEAVAEDHGAPTEAVEAAWRDWCLSSANLTLEFVHDFVNGSLGRHVALRSRDRKDFVDPALKYSEAPSPAPLYFLRDGD